MKKIQQYLLPSLIAVSALSVSASAAFYSVSGLSKLFAGAALAVVIMATSLEVAKLVIASLLYQYRKTLPKFLKYYLSIACFVLILITSLGIYGFLSAAYQKTASISETVDAQITLVETKRDNIKNQLDVFNTEKESINKSVTDLRNGLSNNVITYTNAEGQVMTSTSSATRRTLEKQLDQAIGRQTGINSRVDDLNTKLFDYETEIVEISTTSELAGELGPLKYLSGLTGIPMDRIINYLLLVIIFVFDPLAIALVIAANFAFAQIKPKEEELKDWDVTLMDGLDDNDSFEEIKEEENNLEDEIAKYKNTAHGVYEGEDSTTFEDDLFQTWYDDMVYPLPDESLIQATEESQAAGTEEQIVEKEIPQLNTDIAKDYVHARPGYKPPPTIPTDDSMGGKIY
jgi:uncharacterized protein YlxW (UPF0749 family)